MTEDTNTVPAAAPAPAPAPEPAAEPAEAPFDVAALMGFDPFDDATMKDLGTAPPTKEEKPAEKPAAPEPTAPAPTLTELQAAPPTAPAPPPVSDRLAEALEQLSSAVARPAAPAPAPAADPEAQLNQRMAEMYTFQLPESTRAMLASDDPNQVIKGVTTITNQLGALVHRNVLRDMQAMAANMIQQTFPAMLYRHGELQRQQQEVYTDFYSKFPALNRREYANVVMQASKDLAAARKITRWTPEFRDELGAHLMRLLNVGGAGTGPGVTPPAAVPTPQPNRMLNGGAPRPASVVPGPNGVNSPEDIHSILFGNFGG